MSVPHLPRPNPRFPGVDLLRRIGTVLHFSAQGRIVARLEKALRLGTRLYTSNSHPIGRVIDIFGSINKPFAALKPISQLNIDKLPPGSALFKAKGSLGGGGKRRRK
ncbi:MAG: H/ACA ribonucleoprotein complex subunit GAR1 [Promethearchaeota archaeon]